MKILGQATQLANLEIDRDRTINDYERIEPTRHVCVSLLLRNTLPVVFHRLVILVGSTRITCGRSCSRVGRSITLSNFKSERRTRVSYRENGH